MNKIQQIIFIELYFGINFLFIYIKKYKNLLFFLDLLFLLIILSIQNIGIDIVSYEKLFESFKTLDWESTIKTSSKLELVFRIIFNFLKKNSFDFVWFKVSIAFANIFLLYKIIQREKEKILYVYIYILINFYWCNTNILRQNLSMLFFLIVLYYFYEKKYIKGIFFWLIALFSHKLSFITFLIFFLKNIKIKKFSFLYLILFFIMGIISYWGILKIISLYEGNNLNMLYLKNYFIVGRKSLIFPSVLHKILFFLYQLYPFVINTIIIFIVKDYCGYKDYYNLIYKIMIIGNYFFAFCMGMGIYSLSIFEGGVRLALYFFYGNFLILGNLFSKNKKKLAMFVFIAKIYTILLLIQINRFVGIIPYLFGK